MALRRPLPANQAQADVLQYYKQLVRSQPFNNAKCIMSMVIWINF